MKTGWASIRMGDFLEVKYGRGLSEHKRVTSGSVPVYGSNGIVGRHNAALTEGPAILIGRKGSAGEVHLSKEPCWPIDTTYYIDDFPQGVPLSYWALFLKSLHLAQQDKSSAIPSLRREDLYGITIPVPPLGEQHRIVAKLEELLGKVDACQKRLERLPLILKRFRQSVLAAACSGRLTDGWRVKHKISALPALSSCPRDKIGWHKLKATEACIVVANGSTPRNKPFSRTGDIPFLKIYNIVKQRIDFDYRPQFISQAIHQKELKRSITLPDDVLMNIVGPPLGKVALVPRQFPEWNINQAIVLFRPKPFLLSKFLYFFLCEGSEIRAIENEYRGSAGQSNISLTQAREFTLSVPSLEEQREIIRKVEALFNLADQIESRYNAARASVDQLTQSILAKAFLGELVPQDPKDEPASKLLERLHAKGTRPLEATRA